VIGITAIVQIGSDLSFRYPGDACGQAGVFKPKTHCGAAKFVLKGRKKTYVIIS
jgi:hypothetical protein